MRLDVYGDGIIRVTSTPDPEVEPAQSLMVTARPLSTGFTVAETPGAVTLATPKGSAVVELATGNVSFRNAAGQVVLGESGPPTFAPASADGKPYVSVTPAVQPRHRRGLLRPRPAPEPADELQWRGR